MTKQIWPKPTHDIYVSRMGHNWAGTLEMFSNDPNSRWKTSIDRLVRKNIQLGKPREWYDGIYKALTGEGSSSPIPKNKLDELRRQYQLMGLGTTQDDDSKWFHVVSKNPRTSGEVRFYLDLRPEYAADFQRMIVERVRGLKSFYGSKIAMQSENRDDSMLLYFSSLISKGDMGKVLESIYEVAKEFGKKGVDPFETFDIDHPAAESIFLKGKVVGMDGEMRIGSIVYNPIASNESSGEYFKLHNKPSNEMSWGESTPNTVYAEILKQMNKDNPGRSEEDIRRYLNNFEIISHSADPAWLKMMNKHRKRSEGTFKYEGKDILTHNLGVYEFTQYSLEHLESIIPREYRWM